MFDFYQFKLIYLYNFSVLILIACCLAASEASSEEFDASPEDNCTLFDLTELVIERRLNDECYGLTELPNGGVAINKNSNITLMAKDFLPELPNNFKVSFVMYLRKYYKKLVTFLSIVDECNNFILNITFNPSNQYLTIEIKNFNKKAYQVSFHISKVSLVGFKKLVFVTKIWFQLRKLRLHNLDILFLETGVKVFLGCKQINPVENSGKPRKIVFKEKTTPRKITIFTYSDDSSSPNLDIFEVILTTHTSPPCGRVCLKFQNQK